MINVEINNQTNIRVPGKKIVDLIQFVNKRLKHKVRGVVSLAFVSPVQIKKLNKVYRKKDSVTDVLSFEEDNFASPEASLGEIIICSQRANRQAKELGHSLQREIIRLVLHGYLHLLGYDHIKVKEAEAMEALEEEIMKKFYA